jgi:hypothetical protein
MNPKKIESIFFEVLIDLKSYLSDLVLVGGWMPFIYSTYLWNIPSRKPVTTADIDFGVNDSLSRNYSKTIFKTMSSLNYKHITS